MNKLNLLKWTGYAVSVNDWLGPGKNRLHALKKYKEFVKNMAWTFKAGCRERFCKMGVRITMTVGPLMDHHNLLKPICDALEQAGIIDNDRNIGKTVMEEPQRHEQGEVDIIEVEIIGGWPMEEKG